VIFLKGLTLSFGACMNRKFPFCNCFLVVVVGLSYIYLLLVLRDSYSDANLEFHLVTIGHICYTIRVIHYRGNVVVCVSIMTHHRANYLVIVIA